MTMFLSFNSIYMRIITSAIETLGQNAFSRLKEIAGFSPRQSAEKLSALLDAKKNRLSLLEKPKNIRDQEVEDMAKNSIDRRLRLAQEVMESIAA